MAKRKSIWEDNTSRYGTYEGERGNPSQWASTFGFTFENSSSVQSILGMSAYTVLKISATATDKEITAAYRKLAKIYHTDKPTGNAEKFREITEAYKTIKKLRSTSSDIEKRHRTRSQSFRNESELIIPQLLTPIDESEVENYLSNPDYCAQEKKDGKHLTLQILNGNLIVRNKKGISCSFAPEFENSLRAVGCDILIDGEQIGDKFWVWDILEFNGENIHNLTYLKRYTKLSTLNFGHAIQVLKIAITEKEKRELFENLKTCKEGIVFKKMSAPFTSGKGTDQFKFKFYAECSVIVVAGRKGKASIGMELFNENGEREFVGYCSCNQNPAIGSIAEIKYLYAYRGGCLYQSAFKEIRDDVDIEECTTAQLKYKFEEN